MRGRFLGECGRDHELYTAHDQFPNWYTLYGLNTGSGHVSVIYQTECQVIFMCRLSKPVLNGNAKSVMPKYEAQQKFNSWVQTQLPKMTFSSGCTSWFTDKNGHNSYVFPGYTFMFWLNTIMVNWNQVKVDCPKNTGYKGKHTSKAPYALLLAAAAVAGLLATG